MIHVAIVEDEKCYADQLRQFVIRYGEQSGQEFIITAFRDGDDILRCYKSQFDIILLDIKMTFIDGLTTAEEIRRMDPEVVIMFITNLEQYAIRGYAVDALDDVLKPVSYFAFAQRLERAIIRMKRREKQYMAIKIRGETQKLDIDEIWWVESQDHWLIFHTVRGKYKTKCTLRDVEEKLRMYNFIRCNKGYLANLKYVDSIENGCAMIQGEPLLISRPRKKEFMEALTNYIGSVVK